MVSVPILNPVTVGVKVTLTVQLLPEASELPQLLVCVKYAVVAMLVMDRLAPPLPMLVNVTVLAALGTPTAWLAKVRLLAERIAAAVAVTPASGTIRVLSERLFVMFRNPVGYPTAAGVKVTLIEQLAPAGRLPRQLLVSAKSEAFGPLVAMLVMLSAVD